MANKTSALDVSKINLNSPATASRDGAYSGVQNPYSDQTYTQGWLDRTLGDLGFRTKADQRAEDMDIQAAEFEAGLALKQHDEEYNSPAAKAARLRAAGINPDLVGVDQAENAASMGEDPSTPQPAPSSDGEQLMNVGRAILSGVSTAVGFAKDIASLESIDLQNLNLGSNTFGELFPPEVLEDGQIRPDLAIDVLNRGSAFSRSLRPLARKRYMNNLQNWVGSMNFVTSAYGKASSEKVAHSDYFDAIARAGSDVTQVNLILAQLLSEIAATNREVSLETEGTKLVAEGAEASNRITEAEILDPTLSGEATNESNRATRNAKSIEAALSEPVADKLDDLEDMANNGSGLASKVLLGLSIAATTSPIWSSILNGAIIKKRGKFGKVLRGRK